MNITTALHISFLLSFSSIVHCMDIVVADENLVTDNQLQVLVRSINGSSLGIVHFIKAQVQNHGRACTPQNIGQALQLQQKEVDHLLLYGDDEIKPLALTMGANIQARTKYGQTCLFHTKKPELLTQLIAQGAEVDALDTHGHTPLTHLGYYDKNAIPAARALLAAGANPNHCKGAISRSLLIDATENKHIGIELTTLLCEYKANVNARDGLQNTPLIKATEKNLLEIVETLLLHGADTNLHNQFGEYPLHKALKKDSYARGDEGRILPKIVILLLQHKADPNKPFHIYNYMPLHQAVRIGNFDIVKALIDNGAETHHRDKEGRTPLELAKKGSSSEIINLLEQHTDLSVATEAACPQIPSK